MKKFFTILLAILVVASLVGCASNDAGATKKPEETTSENTSVESNKSSSVEPDLNDPSWTPPQAADPIISAEHNNPEDDPRMIAQVNYKPGYYAFIDEYNLIGYSKMDDGGANGAEYYMEENHDYMPEGTRYLPFLTEKSTDKARTFIDLDGLIATYDIDISDMSYSGLELRITSTTGKKLIIDRWNCSYNILDDNGGIITSWIFHPEGGHGEPIYATALDERHQISNNISVMWVIEQGLKALEDNYEGNPW